MENAIANELGNVLIVGGGRMGQAIAEGLLRIDGIGPERIVIANPGKAKREHLEESLGVRTVEFAAQGLPAHCIVIAVKPKHLADACASLVEGGLQDGSLVISIVAGAKTETVAQLLGNKLPIIRAMPNTPLTCGFGMTALSAGSTASKRECELARELFASMGRAVIVDESKQDIVCAVSGSGPAYFELFCETISRSAENLGLPYDIALELALQTMLGTAELITKTGQSLPDAIDAVSSPGGTTVAALEAMRANGLEEAIEKGVTAAARRSEELGS